MSELADQVIADAQRLSEQFRAEVKGLSDEEQIRGARARYLGKKGAVGELTSAIGKVPGADKRRVGEAFNALKREIETWTEEGLARLAKDRLDADLARSVDVTLPARSVGGGSLHLLTQVRLEAAQIFAELGFVVADGPQIETDWNNFEALAMPQNHPARDMQDTFYLADEIVLRTHTSPVQVRTMLVQPPPIRIVAPGQVFRRDDDPTHSPMFTQLEGLVVDEGISFADLKGVLLHFVKRFFAKDLGIRLRPSYFPFVEPGAEVDMQCTFCGGSGCRLCKGTGWIEIGGSGMVDPDVFAHVGIDSEKYTGFAFGMGLERMAMLRHDVNDIKFYYEGDIRFLEQFR
ncbi:MAG TPA: phenylalanine--tRNA ligase subunit alpha [Kofleriaceae bacterium]|jgi:phenylalanyl-tRNA synthetase alpha chain